MSPDERSKRSPVAAQGDADRASVVRAGIMVATMVAAIASTYFVPALEQVRPWVPGDGYVPFWNLLGRDAASEGRENIDAQLLGDTSIVPPDPPGLDPEAPEPDPERPTLAPDVDPSQSLPRYVPRLGEDFETKVAIEHPEYLDGFFNQLTATDLQIDNAITRVTHWGDSSIGNDGVTAALRGAFQERFGDAGHGFHALSQYDASYRHKGVVFDEAVPWQQCYVIRRSKTCVSDRRYGLGGSTAFSRGTAVSRYATPTKGTMGREIDSFELWYLAHASGGSFEIRLDGTLLERVDTRADNAEDRWKKWQFPPGAHSLEVRGVGPGSARGYGVVLERERSGVVWDGIALIGSWTNRMVFQDPDHLANQVRHRDPDLIVLSFGGNDLTRETGDLRTSMVAYERDLELLLGHLRRGKPGVACLIVAPLDHGERQSNRIVSRPIVPRMVRAQRDVAERSGCAFFDTFEAMGGNGSAARWFRNQPRLMSPDLSHANPRGQQVLGRGLVYRAIMAAYVEFRGRRVGMARTPRAPMSLPGE